MSNIILVNIICTFNHFSIKYAGRQNGWKDAAYIACHGYHNADRKSNAASASHCCGYRELPVEYTILVVELQKRLNMDGILNCFLKEGGS